MHYLLRRKYFEVPQNQHDPLPLTGMCLRKPFSIFGTTMRKARQRGKRAKNIQETVRMASKTKIKFRVMEHYKGRLVVTLRIEEATAFTEIFIDDIDIIVDYSCVTRAPLLH